MMKTIPTKINKYNVYRGGNRLLGVGEELTLPDFEALSETVSGAGLLGEIDDPTVGAFGNMEQDVPFRLLDEDAFDMMDMTKAVDLEIRGAAQTVNSSGDIEFVPVRVALRGRSKKLGGGKLKAGSPMDSGVTLTVLYILIEVDGSPMVELDKINEVFKVRGVDILAKIKEMC